ncbi:MAG: riboflavin synthase [Candidatus Adiutrix sp.]|jgi:riboflavin synthase|nr:riboflavin synthase [Candidatus Adiutrix sp.]
MFTGLTLGLGEIGGRVPDGGEFELTVVAGFAWSDPLELGESIAVNGACLTVAARVGPRGFRAHASGETVRRTTLGTARRVNLERALALGDRLGGHIVSGHVDGLGTLISARRSASSLVCEFGAAADLMSLIIPKGSIAIDGVSLTVNEISAETFTVNLIPHTAEMTTIGFLRPGDRVNLETDLIGKYVKRLMTFDENRPRPEGLTLEFLARHGFGR